MLGVGRYNSLSIGIAVQLKDEFTRQARNISSEFGRMQAQMAMKNAGSIQQIGGAMLGAGVAGALFYRGAIKDLAEFEHQLNTIGTVIGNVTAPQLDTLRKTIKRIGYDTVFSMEDIAAGAEVLARADYSIGRINSSLGGIADLAAAGKITMAQSAESMATIMTVYDMAAGRAPHVADVIAYSANKSIGSIEDMMQALKYSAATSKMLNVPFEETMAVIARLSQGGLKGSIGGVSYSNMMSYMSKLSGEFRTKRQGEAMKLLGLVPSDIVDANGNLKSRIELLDTMVASMGKLGNTERQNAAEALFGKRGLRAYEALTAESKNGIRTFKDYMKLLTENNPEVKGYASRSGKALMDDLAGDIERLGEAWGQLKKDLVNFPGLRFLVKGFTTVLRVIDNIVSTPMGKFLSSVAFVSTGILATVGALEFSMGTLLKLVSRTTFGFNAMGVAGRRAAGGTAAAMGSAGMFGGSGGAGWGTGGYGWSGSGLGKGMSALRQNSAGRWINSRGKFVSGGVASRYMGRYSSALVGGMPAGMSGALGKFMTGTGKFGSVMGKIGGIAGKAAPFLGAFGAALGGIFDLLDGKMGAGLGGIGGGLLGLAFGGPLGAFVGGMLGGGIGGLFDKDDIPTNSRQSVTEEEFMRKYLLARQGAMEGKGFNQTLNIQLDGMDAYSKKINGDQNESVYENFGLY